MLVPAAIPHLITSKFDCIIIENEATCIMYYQSNDFLLNKLLNLYFYRLEIQADINSSAKRNSLSSETASVCLSMDDAAASTRGLAGSVLSYKVNVEDSKSEASCDK